MTWDLFSSAAEARQVQREEAPPARSMPRAVPAGPGRRAVRPGEEWSVTEVNAAAKELVEGAFPPLWIAGEIANFSRARSGHCYFTLRDDGSQIRCVMWREDAERLPTTPQEGMAVRALGRLTIYPARGDFQASVSRLEGKGDGLWKLALERLRQKLEAEGLMAPARKRPLPRHPRVVGVVTSPSGAVFHDIVNVVRRRAPWTRVVLAGCRVQGDGAAAEVAAAIRLFALRQVADVLIVARGGGSVEDLWAFNEEMVARAIADCPVPVISAVGHETDVTIADLVADLRAPTPSAAAESAVPDRADLARGLMRDGWRLHQAVAGRIGRAREEVRLARGGLVQAGERVATDRRERLRAMARHLEALSPLAAFTRGYAVPLSADGRILRRQADFSVSRDFGLRVSDGLVSCRVVDGKREAAPVPTEKGIDGGPRDA